MLSLTRSLPLSLFFFLGACPEKTTVDTAETYSPDIFCPGDPSGNCDEIEGAQLQAGAASVSIIPECFESWTDTNEDGEYDDDEEFFLDCGCDRLCPEDEGYTKPDEGEGDEEFQAIWLAGFGSPRAASGVRDASLGMRGENDGIWSKTLVLRQGESTIALVSLDLIGWFFDDVQKIREMAVAEGLDVDHILVHATHQHEGPDTMGIWGPSITKSGYNEEYAEQVRQATVESIRQALEVTKPVSMVSGTVDVSTFNEEKGVRNVIQDKRDPWVIDELLHAAQFIAEDGSTVGTLVNWGNHPEALAHKNLLITSDYVHALRETVESGSQWETAGGIDGVGGTCVFLNASVGGMMTPLGVEVTDPDGSTWSDASFEKADAIGQLVGEMALEALNSGQAVENPKLSFRAKTFYSPIDNIALQAMWLVGTLDRGAYNYDTGEDLTDENVPEVRTEIDVIEVGPIQMLTVPGELLPELAIGGYDGSHINAPDAELFDPKGSNPPNIANAPEGPYLKDRMTGESKWIIGLANDEIGYIIPEYNFKLHETMPYLDEADGDHYEETRSLGPNIATQLDQEAEALLNWQP